MFVMCRQDHECHNLVFSKCPKTAVVWSKNLCFAWYIEFPCIGVKNQVGSVIILSNPLLLEGGGNWLRGVHVSLCGEASILQCINLSNPSLPSPVWLTDNSSRRLWTGWTWLLGSYLKWKGTRHCPLIEEVHRIVRDYTTWCGP